MLNRASAGLWAAGDVYIIQQKCDPETARPTNAYFDSTPPRARAMSPPNPRPEPFLVEDVTLPIQLTYHAPLECARGNAFTGKVEPSKCLQDCSERGMKPAVYAELFLGVINIHRVIL
ncbi:hypothetical protein BOTBODRAFT_247236 [Botryobasidium botryosum FD-172 SS1]|uniref:Uncharacterized protein n=1 Tax=Botryobasidium botryosum (strain FD-172 SS1) TaxID=930990 RepID=A0A067LW40_BOTB1|nr:hypothetical protein BOTBODRAFT_247236 [Botryobasidium botryosum FD-172 SS1]